MFIKGDFIYLRALEMGDLDFLYELENNPAVWEISGTTAPYSKHVLRMYLDNAHRDIYDVKQLRLCICKHNDAAIGLLDLFDFDPKNRRAGVGIIISQATNRNQGAGQEALQLLSDYAFSVLNLKQLYANVLEDNDASIHLFKKLGFAEVGLKKDWILSQNGFKNEILLQKINNLCT
ncbi:GNAT family N-acetyltransferase [Arenibacter sp. GZD96]|uniref:GNAT family N-acetyltransferase n=1 Tax=Aurantibrevibacter litoralis TaxID=3106030 RepID=UPI002AFFB5C4|nr:GNAT family N-acetyltransferase [Arenibacter sp. GZD-96]MEA1786319.1 GNAT family N-acetyltransferase [Arenibacter sp. GZD-96]